MRIHFIRPYHEEIRFQISGALAESGFAIGRIFGPDEPMSAVLLWIEQHERDGFCIPYMPGTGGTGIDVLAHIVAKHPEVRVLMPVRECSAEAVVHEVRERLKTIDGAEPGNVLPMRVERILSNPGVLEIQSFFGVD